MDKEQELHDVILKQGFEIERLQESLNDIAGRLEGLDWDLVTEAESEHGLSLDRLKDIDRRLSDMCAANPLMKRAAQLRNDYVFGKGIEFKNLKPGTQKVVEDEWNERVLFSVLGYEGLNLARMTGGNLFVMYDKNKKSFTRIPLQEVTGLLVDPDDAERIWAVRRSWTGSRGTRDVWYRTSNYTGTLDKNTFGSTARGNAIIAPPSQIVFHEAYNRQVGHTLGVPDGLAAMSWALAYSNYLNNNATLVKAYAQFAFKVTQATRKGIENAAAKVAKGGVGGSALLPVGADLSPLNATGSQVNFNNGQALAAMVATSLGLSVVALLSSPGAASGSYGAAASLDGPTLIGMVSVQEQWRMFYKRILRHVGSKDAEVEFPSIESDPVYRQIASLALAFTSGAITQKEFRSAVLDLMDIRDADPNSLPKPSAFAAGTMNRGSADPVPRQGNTGAVPGGMSQGDTNNDNRTDVISNN